MQLSEWRHSNGSTTDNFYVNISRKYTKGGKTAAFRRECKSTLPPNMDRYAHSGGVCLLAGSDCTAQSVNLYLVSDTPVQTARHTCHLIILANGGALTDLRRFKLKVL